MGEPEKQPENKPENANEAPKLDAILPDELPPAAAELVDDLDSYQKRMEREWDSAKVAYENKINRIMEEFMVNGMNSTEEKPTPKPEVNQRPRPSTASSSSRDIPPLKHTGDDRLRNLMKELEKEFHRANEVSKQLPLQSSRSAEALQLGWHGDTPRPKKKFLLGLLLIFGLSCAGFYLSTRLSIQRETLPYARTLGPVLANGNIYIVDWFRKVLYVHAEKKGLPIQAVETLPNELPSGFALSAKMVWTLNGMDRKIFHHVSTPDHQVVLSVDAPGQKPVGLFYDGVDLWSADQIDRKLYRHRGNDVAEIKDTYPLPDIHVTAFVFYKNRLWILDGKSRLVSIYRLQKPMLQLGSFDLDPFLKSATPTGMAIQNQRLSVVTENPSQYISIPIARLKRSKLDAF